MDTLVQDSTAFVPHHWTLIAVIVVVVLAVIAAVGYAIHAKRKADKRRAEYLRTHPETDPHQPRDRYDDSSPGKRRYPPRAP